MMIQKFNLLKAMGVSRIWKSEKPHHSSSELSLSLVYPEDSLLGLPIELLRKIIQNLESEDWLNLCLTCKYFSHLVNKFFLYQDVKIRDMTKLLKFRKSISKNKKTNILSLYVTRIEFVRPLKEPHKVSTSIAGSFSYEENSNDRSETYIGLMLEVISLLPNLSEIFLRQISPGFQFPEWTSSLKTYAHEHNYYPSIRKLKLSSEKEWSIALRPNLLWSFGLIQELILCEMVIDSTSLTKPHLLTVANKQGPLINKHAVSYMSTETWSPIKELSLISCSIASNGFRHLEEYFREVEVLKLLALNSHYDILLGHCFPALKELHLDLNSKCFSFYDNQVAHSINVGNNNSNYTYFNSKFVPNFYANYTKFSEVLEKLPTAIQKINLTNVSFTNMTPVDPKDTDNPENNSVNNNLFNFLQLLMPYESIEFTLLKSYKLHHPRSYRDWERLLEPCFTSTNSTRVKDRDGSVLFSRNEKY